MATSRAVVLLGLWERHSKLFHALATPALLPFSDMSLSRWVRLEDRGVPAELVKRTIGSLLRANFDELLETPGVGVTKLAKLMEILERVGTPPDGASNLSESAWSTGPANGAASERKWNADVETIRSNAWGDLPLGRLAPSLDKLPRNLWMTPLSRFISLSYNELHSIPYFGSRRISAVREIVSVVAGQLRTHEHLVDRTSLLTPYIRQAQDRLIKADVVTADVVLRDVASPLFAQLDVDLGGRAVMVACTLLGLDARSARNIAGFEQVDAEVVSPPRRHQIREDIRLAIQVRWPDCGELFDACALRAGDTREAATAYTVLDRLCHLLCGRRLSSRPRLVAHWPAEPALSVVGR